MTFYGDEIGLIPQMRQIEIYIAEKGLYITPQQVWDYWSKKEWKTLKGNPVKTLEAAVNVANGVLIGREIYHGIKLKGKTKTQKKKERREIKNKLIGSVKRKAKEISYENHQPQPYSRYEEQLKDERWNYFRMFIFNVRGRKCEVCGSTKNLQIHHTRYLKYCKAWEYTCNDVMVLCDTCHKRAHGLLK